MVLMTPEAKTDKVTRGCKRECGCYREREREREKGSEVVSVVKKERERVTHRK